MRVEAEKPLAGRYRLLSVIGKGGMGTVWRAYDELLDRDVAIKEAVLPEGLTSSERCAMCRRIVAEARATAALRHPGVVTVYDVLNEDGRPWIVMELLRARSLREVLARDGPLDSARAAEIGRAVLAVLNTAHAKGILHRDVKPSNVMLAEDGRILLTDFGLAVHMLNGHTVVDTMVSGIQGSPAYLSPEQILGMPGGTASDLWSLGVTLYAAVEGGSPFRRSHALATMVAVLIGEYAPPWNAGPPMRALIEGLLRQDPSTRLSAAEVAALLDLAADRPDDTWRSRRATWWENGRTSMFRRSRITALVGVAILAATVIVIGAWTARLRPGGTMAALSAQDRGTHTAAYREADGYSVEIPSGWVRERRRDGVHWNDPLTDRHLRISPVQGDALAGLQQAERDAIAANAYPGYRRIRLEATPDVAKDAAEWEFTTHRFRYLRSRMAGYEFLFITPEDRWTPGQRAFEAILRTFRTSGS
ncbi:Serine/threonine protein kinase [Thermomonospora echinospora]|uniref:non-specific serine/threonine protein kinase n=1 Tax=Thermomonospora echinospora TaxID=1992 RepID=A0A1H6CCG3_9ACTN|nr:serine/threonine-protein kinase [Thermomonospora echinospora]SEG70644.1 Serine/threonine protein kinase [Thermomonospora echinospora]